MKLGDHWVKVLWVAALVACGAGAANGEKGQKALGNPLPASSSLGVIRAIGNGAPDRRRQ